MAILDRRLTTYALLAILASSALADDDLRGQDKTLYWGDLHVHTNLSMDAFAMGERLTPLDAYGFAKGGSVTLADGSERQLERPLDFVALTDHAETFGLMTVCNQDGPQSDYCSGFEAISDGTSFDAFRVYFLPALFHNESVCNRDDVDCEAGHREAWQRVIENAEAANQPGKFTAFVANEWSLSPGNLHWHRNLIYRNANVPARAINSIDEPDAIALWRALDERCKLEKGCEVLAIPHNSNLGLGGSFFEPEASAADLTLRSRFETLLEIHQHKGSSECYPGALLSDEACSFEIRLPIPIERQGSPVTREQQDQIATGYARHALGEGLKAQQAEGLNPFRYGFVGATDTHGARPGDVEESDWRGSSGRFDIDAQRRNLPALKDNNPGGLTGVWAEANTRDALFSAMKRREVFATSGPRIALRISLDHDTSVDRCSNNDTPATAIMGQTVTAALDTPVLTVEALKDGMPLHRVDIIRLSLDGDSIRQDVNIVTLNETQASHACVQFADTTFDPDVPTLWYARVLQEATPRWRRNEDGSEVLINERAWSSPIWYEP